MKKNYKNMPDNLKCVFQEFYRLSVLPVDDCQLLLGAAFPLFEIRTTEHAKGRGDSRSVKRRRECFEEKAGRYGRLDIERTLYNSEDNGFSSSQLLRVVSLDLDDASPWKHHSKEYPYIGVSIIPVTLSDDHKRYKLLVMIDKQTAITAVHLFKVLRRETVSKEVVCFINALSKFNLRRKGVYFVDTGDKRTMNMIEHVKSSIEDVFPKMVTDTYAKYNFQYPHSLQFDVNQTVFEGELKKLLYKFNIGESRKRPGPYLRLKYRLKNRNRNNKIEINESTIPSYIKEIIKLT